MQKKIKFILSIIFMAYASAVFSSQEVTIKKANELKDIASQLQGADPTISDDSDLVALDKVIGSAKVVGLGEDTHGTHEFFQMKHRILQYLVKKKGFTIFSIEASMPQAYQLNDYVLDGKGDPKKLIANMGYWTWDTKEVLAMVEWMHEYNKTAEKKVKFTGFDMRLQPNTYKKNITDHLNKAGKEDESEIINQIIADIDPVDQKVQEYSSALEKRDIHEEDALKKYSQLLEDLKEKHLPDDEFKKEAAKLELDYKNEIKQIDDEFSHITQAIKDEENALIFALNIRIDKLVRDIVSNKDLFISKLGANEYEWMLENIQLIKEYLQLQATFDNDTRDQLMAKNILWIVQQNPDARLMLWAHNGHIGHSDKYPSMGKYLQNELAENYKAIGFLTYQGKYTAVADDAPKLDSFDLQIPPDDAMEAIINTLGMPNVLLNLSKNTLPEFLYNPVLSRCGWGIGAMEMPVEWQFNPPPDVSFSDFIGFNYDGLIYIKTTTASQLLFSASYKIKNKIKTVVN